MHWGGTTLIILKILVNKIVLISNSKDNHNHLKHNHKGRHKDDHNSKHNQNRNSKEHLKEIKVMGVMIDLIRGTEANMGMLVIDRVTRTGMATHLGKVVLVTMPILVANKVRT